MRYRRLSYRYTTLTSSSAALGWPLVEAWPGDRLRLLMQGRWRPDADAYETNGSGQRNAIPRRMNRQAEGGG